MYLRTDTLRANPRFISARSGALPEALRNGITPDNIRKLDAVFGTKCSTAFNSALNISTSTIITKELLKHHFGANSSSLDNLIGKNWGDVIKERNAFSIKDGNGVLDYVK